MTTRLLTLLITIITLTTTIATTPEDQPSTTTTTTTTTKPHSNEDKHRHPRDELHYQHHQHSNDEGDEGHPHPQVNNDNEHHKQLYAQHHQHHQQPSTTSRVLELSDRFLDIVNNVLPSPQSGTGPLTEEESRFQPWLVMFYAPWCGHCKRLEPIFNHVAQALHNTPIRVGRVDCTRFPVVGSEYKIHGYPTIMFISGPTRRHTFQGDRELSEIVRFATRMSSPPVTLSPLPLQTFLEKHTQSNNNNNNNNNNNPARVKREEQHEWTLNGQTVPDLFFGISKPIGYRDKVTDAFRTVAGKYQQHNEFYEFSNESSDVVIFVVKSGRIVMFDHESGIGGGGGAVTNVTSLLEHWVGNERFPDFIHLTRGNLYQVFSERDGPYLKDLIVAAVVNEDRLERIQSDQDRRLLNVLKGVARSSIIASTPQTQTAQLKTTLKSTTTQLPHIYAWIGTPEIANSIVAESLPLPTLLIIQKSPSDQNHKYYVFSDFSTIDTESEVENILELVKEGHFSPTVHANSLSFKLYRYAFDAKVSLTDMWVGNPVLTIVLFGLPLGFLSLILYSVCCGDIMDAKEEEEEEEEEDEGGDDHYYGDNNSDDGGGGGGSRRRVNHEKRE